MAAIWTSYEKDPKFTGETAAADQGSPAAAAAIFYTEFERTLDHLHALGVPAVVVDEVTYPPHGQFHPAAKARQIWHNTGGGVVGLSLADYTLRQANYELFLEQRSDANLHRVKTSIGLCGEDGFCSVFFRGYSVYFDGHHLSTRGAALLAPELERVLSVAITADS